MIGDIYKMNETTIVAPATALINQAISIIRVSGQNTYQIINKIFSKKVTKPTKNQIVYGYIKENNQVIDEVLLMCFKKPYSFTGEDMIEINCHGGIFITKKIINILLKNGAILAKNGEFSQRAFINGKINLVQADSINNLIMSTNDVSAQISINTILGKNFKPVIEFRKKILDIIANIEVNIDYPEYDGIGDLQLNDLNLLIKELITKIKRIIELSKLGKLINEGVKTVIIGRPNVGKSSFLNALLNEDKAIVSELEGTTRDLVEGKINVEGITLNLIDTAGIRKTENIIEKIGINKTKEVIQSAQLVLLILDGSKILSKEDKKILEIVSNTNYVIIKNKSDIQIDNFDKDNILKNKTIINISAKKRQISDFLKFINNKFEEIELTKQDNLILLNINHINILTKILKLLNLIYDRIKKGVPVDILNIDLHEIWNLLGKLLGEEYQEDILDVMFRNYCLGK